MRAEKNMPGWQSKRKRVSGIVWSTALVLLAWCSQRPAFAQTTPLSDSTVTFQVPIAPTPVRANNNAHLYYEVHLTNFGRRPVELVRLEVHANSASGPILASYADAELAGRLLRPGLPNDAPNKRVIQGGLRAILYLDLDIDDKTPVPASVWHRAVFNQSSSSNGSTETSVDNGPIPIGSASPVSISPPLRGGDWLAANGPSNTSKHRRALLIVNGDLRIAQRFAIDWIKLGANGLPSHDDPSRNSNWWGYGTEILAVADGTIVATKDGIPENIPLTNRRAVPITLETLAGNHVVLDLGSGRYATFAHLQPGSLRVSVGSKVRRGQVLGLLGNSGNSDAPHLHFHVTDGRTALGSEGVPYVFDYFQLRGTLGSLEELVAGQSWHAVRQAKTRTKEIPLENAVVQFP